MSVIGSTISHTRVPCHQIWNNEVLAVFPRYKEGVPVTVGATSLLDNKCTPVWKPFPCWSLQEEGNCNAIQNAVDIVVDHKVHTID